MTWNPAPARAGTWCRQSRPESGKPCSSTTGRPWPVTWYSMLTPPTSTRLTRLPHSVDLVRSDAEDDADLVTPAEPRVSSAQIALGEGLDVLCASLGGDLDDPPADRVVAMRAGASREQDGHRRGARDTA